MKRPADGRFGLRGYGERLAEILLMDPAHASVFASGAVIALDQQKCSITNDSRLDRRHIETDCGGKAHHEGLVLGRSRETRYGRLENMRGRLARRRQRHRAIHQNDRHLRLRAGERETQSFLARKQRASGQRIQHPDQACIVKRGWPLIEGESGRCFAGWQKL